MVHLAWIGKCQDAMATVSLTMLILLSLASTEAIQQISNPRIVEHPEDQYVARNEPATLNCKAEGEPPPIITWYKRGQPVITSNENPASHRMLLPSGQLFFLKIIHNNKNQTDVGVYYCNATNPETMVSAVSRNATLDVATIRDDFREQPKNTEVAVGGEVVLPCRPPRGKPEPHVRWKKDSDPVKTGDRIILEESGALRLRDAKKEDSGIYVCVAYNVGGERDSIPARLTVRERPRILEGPKDATVSENSDVLFRCRTNSDMELTIIWKKVDGQIPPGRSWILDDRSLKIEKVDVNDEGIYICRVENSVGFQESEARLSVHSQPSFVVTPHDKTVSLGRQATFRCQVTGNPVPAVFWSKEANQQNLMFPNYDSGRFSVLEDGTLIIDSVQREDAGEYTCKGLSIAGSAYAKARLEVKDLDPRPPPIIQQGPQNQTLPVSTIAMLQCSASGEPPPVIRWFKNSRELTMRDARFALLDSGALQISDLRKSDTGIYTCKASSDTGETSSWSAALVVETPTNSAVIFHRTPEPSTFPGPPSKPVVQEIADTSVRLAWRASSNHGSSPVHAYTVEYFSHETGEGWIIATDSVRETTYTIKNLRPDTSYLFLVRSQNSHGLSMPSPVTAPIRTKVSANAPGSVPQIDPSLVSEKLGQQIVTVLQPEVLNSTAVKVSWEVRRNQKFIEGFHVKYRMLLEQEEQSVQSASPHGRHSDFTVETIQASSATQYVLNHLAKYTWYEIRVQPFYGTIEGQDSNTIRVRTFEDVPSAPPDKIQWRMIDNSTMHLAWEAPPKNQRNGPLRGYKIYLYGNETRYNQEIHVNSSSDSVVIPHLFKDMTYRIQLSAYNRIGEGVRSDILTIGSPRTSGVQLGVIRQPWFIATLILTIGGALWFALCVFSIWLYRKRRNRKLQKNGAVSNKSEDAGNLLGYPVKSAYNVVPTAPQPDVTCQAADVTALDGYSTKASDNSSDYYNCRGAVMAPYAKAMVPVGASPFLQPKNDSAFRPIQSYIIQKPFEDDSGVRSLLTDGPPRYTPTDQRDFRISPMSEFRSGDSDDTGNFGRSLSCSKQPMLFLPPPPEHPPPSDIGTPPDSPVLRHYGPGANSGLPPIHPTGGGGAALRMLFHDHSGSDRSRSFSPRSQNQSNDANSFHQAAPNARCPASPVQRARPASPRSYHNPRTYSPQAISDPEYGRGVSTRQSYEPLVAQERELSRPFSDTEGVSVVARRGQNYAPPSPAPGDPVIDRAVQSSLASLGGGECVTPLPRPDIGVRSELYVGRGDSPISEIGAYPGLESDMETNAPRDCHSPVSSMDEMERAVADSVLASWTNAIEDSDTNCSSVRSSAVSSSDGSFFAEADFASAVARAAEMSGLTVIGSTIIDPNSAKDREKIKKPAKHRQRAARPTSPYSTDSNYSAVQIPHRPYPKSERKKQLIDQGSRHKPSNGASKGQSSNIGLRPLPALPSKLIVHDKSNLNGGEAGSKILPPQHEMTSADFGRLAIRTNPLDAFDMRDTPIV